MDLKEYLKTLKPAPLDPKWIEEYERQMREETIPKIVQSIKDNQRRVAEIRHKVLF